ncbi:MAG: hypothetical protein KGJ84_07075 [Elusimicrobia bacterium]|nr:hypothetical protein [Elusimicrobiota bacterium]
MLAYLALHPTAPAPVQALVNAAAAVAAGAALAFVAWGLGWTFLRAFAADDDGLVSEATAFAAGAGAIAGIILLLGVRGLLRPGALAATAVVSAVLAVRGAWSRRSSIRSAAVPSDRWEAVFQGVAAHVLFSGFIHALAPVSDYDVLVYHLPLARNYLKAGRIAADPWLIFAQWPHAASLLYLPAEALGLDSAASLLHWTATAAWISAVGAAAAGWIDRRAAWAAAAVLLAQPVVANFIGEPRVESWWALYVFLAFYWLRRAQSGPSDSRRLALAGLLSGLAASVKLIGAFDAAALAGLAFFAGVPRSVKRRAVDAAKFAAAALIPSAPWFAKTWLEMGNPVWPLASSLFGASWHSPHVAMLFVASSAWPHATTLAFALRQGPQFLLIPAAAAAFAATPVPAFLLLLAALAAAHGAAVAWSYEAWRYLIPVFPAAALAAAWAWERSGRSLFYSAALAVGLFPAVYAGGNNQLFAVLEVRSTLRPGVPPREMYLERSLDSYTYFRAADAALASAGPGSRVLLFSECLSGLLKADAVCGNPIYQGVLSYDDLDGPDALRASARALGITHVSVDWESPDLPTYGPRAADLMHATLARYADRILTVGPRSLYRFRL